MQKCPDQPGSSWEDMLRERLGIPHRVVPERVKSTLSLEGPVAIDHTPLLYKPITQASTRLRGNQNAVGDFLVWRITWSGGHLWLLCVHLTPHSQTQFAIDFDSPNTVRLEGQKVISATLAVRFLRAFGFSKSLPPSSLNLFLFSAALPYFCWKMRAPHSKKRFFLKTYFIRIFHCVWISHLCLTLLWTLSAKLCFNFFL